MPLGILMQTPSRNPICQHPMLRIKIDQTSFVSDTQVIGVHRTFGQQALVLVDFTTKRCRVGYYLDLVEADSPTCARSGRLALSAGEPDAEPTAGASQPQREARANQWEALWRRIRESADAQVRSSEEIEEFWKSQLDEFLENAHRAHQALLPQICDLADEPAAQAVIRYYDQYFSANFPTATPDGTEQE